MDDSKNKLLEKIKASNAVLITVSNNPTVDQLAACIAFALVINKLNKTGSALYSGQTPSTIEFLKPDQTLEKNTDSLQDFIISLDKNKADKLRTKVDEQSVKIFITPYKSSLSESDLEFSQGDFNVDLIIALGVYNKEELDSAITNHGGILHDATISTVTVNDPSDLGSINWNDSSSSSFCELVASLTKSLGNNLLDEQVATALLTGIVAETDRFSNDKTTPQTMSISSELMNAGANPKLIANELGSNSTVSTSISGTNSAPDNTETLNIDHDLDELLGKDEENNKEDDLQLPKLESDSMTQDSQENELTQTDVNKDETPQSDTPPDPKVPQINKYPGSNGLESSLADALNEIPNPTPQDQSTQDAPKKEELPSFVPPSQSPNTQEIKPLENYNSTQPFENPVEGINQDQVSGQNNVPNLQPAQGSQSFTPPPSDWQAPAIPTQDQTYPAITTNHDNLTEDQQIADHIDDARNSVDSAFGQDEVPSGAPTLPPSDVTSDQSQSFDPLNSPNVPSEVGEAKSQQTTDGNLTGLDPSLFSEPQKNEQDNSNAPPVPPPVVQLPFNNNDQKY